jgi:tetratricopeptide (TPR) repeat protein
MKVIFALALTFFAACDLSAQAHRRATAGSGMADGPSIPTEASDPLTLRMRLGLDAEPAAPPRPGNPIPVSQLRIPSKAMKEFERSQKAFQSGDIPTSAEHLQRALQVYPEFLQAHNFLGLRYLQLGDYQKALAEHELALALDPRNSQTHEDLSMVLTVLNRAPEAETEARLALEINPRSVSARYVLARALIAQRRATSEAMEMLVESENTFHNASLVLAQIHFSAGRTEQTITELRKYLRAPEDKDNKQKAECWIAQLSQQTLPAGCPAGVTRPSFR